MPGPKHCRICPTFSFRRTEMIGGRTRAVGMRTEGGGGRMPVAGVRRS